MAAHPTLIQRLGELIALPSVSSTSPQWDSGNLDVVERLAGWLEDLGFAVELMRLPYHPRKANLIATLGSGPGGLVLAGHTDTVPCDPERWRSDPFALCERDGRLYGLGSCDMKGFFPVAIEAARAFVETPLQAPLIILATADEESTMDGARALVQAGRPRARAALIGEPTSLVPIRAHKGIMMEGLRLTGRSGHSSDPALGNSALEAMHEALGELLQLRAELQARYRDPHFAVQVPTLNLGHIHGGDNPNRICGQCELHFDLRLLPGMHTGELRQCIHQRLQPLAERRGVGFELWPLIPGVEAYAEPADSELVLAVERLTGHRAETVAFATEAPLLQSLGMQTVVCGPGSIARAHQPDEYLELEQIQPAIDMLQALIRQYCL